MASVSIRKVVSPRNLASVFRSPKVNQAVAASLKDEIDWSPSVASVSGKNSLSPYVKSVNNVLSPYSRTRFVVLTSCDEVNLWVLSIPNLCFSKPQPVYASAVPRKSKSARKLPWSDGGNSPSPFEDDSFTYSLQPNVPLSSKVNKCCHFEPSADTPDRAELIKCFRQKRSGLHILGKGTFGTVLEATYKGVLYYLFLFQGRFASRQFRGKPAIISFLPTGHKVAVKIVPSSAEACRQVKNEMNCLSIRHPNIVSVLKVTLPDEDIAGIVIMERVCGYSLQKFLDLGFLRDKINLRFRLVRINCTSLIVVARLHFIVDCRSGT